MTRNEWWARRDHIRATIHSVYNGANDELIEASLPRNYGGGSSSEYSDEAIVEAGWCLKCKEYLCECDYVSFGYVECNS